MSYIHSSVGITHRTWRRKLKEFKLKELKEFTPVLLWMVLTWTPELMWPPWAEWLNYSEEPTCTGEIFRAGLSLYWGLWEGLTMRNI